LKIKKGVWKNGKRHQWIDNVTDEEKAEQAILYSDILELKETKAAEIKKKEKKIKLNASKQLGYWRKWDPEFIEFNPNLVSQQTNLETL
jgi:hypothetical protein